MYELSIIAEEASKVLLLGISAAFILRVGRFPDVGIQGTFLLGGCVTASPVLNNFTADPFILFLISGAIGALFGVVTAALFIYARIHALMVGILTLLIAYSLGFYILGGKTAAILPKLLYTEGTILIFSLLIGLLLLIYLSTYNGIRLIVAMKTPILFYRARTTPDLYIVAGLALGHSLAAISGHFFVGAEGQATIQKANEMFFNTLIIIVCGEALLELMFTALKALNKKNTNVPSYICRAIKFTLQYIRGGGALSYFLAAIIGTYIYWYIFDLTSEEIGSNEYTKGIFAITTILLLSVMSKLKRSKLVASHWKFHGYREW